MIQILAPGSRFFQIPTGSPPLCGYQLSLSPSCAAPKRSVSESKEIWNVLYPSSTGNKLLGFQTDAHSTVLLGALTDY